MTNTKKDQVVAGMYIDLLAVQKEIKDVSKDASNPFFKSSYATLGAVIAGCKDILNAHNFVVLQPIQSDENGVYVCTTLYHISGGTIKSKLKIDQKENNNPQAQGSAITYARRYALQSILCMNAEDDDGNMATGKSKKVQPKQNSEVSPLANEGQKKMIFAIAKEAGFEGEKAKEIVKKNFNLESFNDITVEQANKAIEGFNKKVKKESSS